MLLCAGLVTPVKNQQQCGACTAFASIAAMETCFARVSGLNSSYSEQQFIDCGNGHGGAKGCYGAPAHAYLDYFANVLGRRGNASVSLAAEAVYPFLNNKPRLSCPTLAPYRRRARLGSAYYTYHGSEDMLKALVYRYGAVVSTLSSNFSAFLKYDGGGRIFDSCPTKNASRDHAVTVVGYGSENGTDYWLVKNSWGPLWGDRGFMRLKRGVGMCGLGRDLVVVTCLPEAGPPDPTLFPCYDSSENCTELAKTSCYLADVAAVCMKSCGLCPGMQPAASTTCYDVFRNCGELAGTSCYLPDIAANCSRSCGLCKGMTPVESNTCYDVYQNCKDLAQTSCYLPDVAANCSRSCGLCKGMTPAFSVDCYDAYANCPAVAETSCYRADVSDQCRRSCGNCPGLARSASFRCYDAFSDCARLAEASCYRREVRGNCSRSCGLCEGATPVLSNTCYDNYSNCQVLARTSCYLKDVGAECGRSCGLCGGLTPAASVTCYDAYQNCGQLAKTACSQKAVAAKCVKSCGNCKSAVVTTTKTTVNSILYS